MAFLNYSSVLESIAINLRLIAYSNKHMDNCCSYTWGPFYSDKREISTCHCNYVIVGRTGEWYLIKAFVWGNVIGQTVLLFPYQEIDIEASQSGADVNNISHSNQPQSQNIWYLSKQFENDPFYIERHKVKHVMESGRNCLNDSFEKRWIGLMN